MGKTNKKSGNSIRNPKDSNRDNRHVVRDKLKHFEFWDLPENHNKRGKFKEK